MTRPDEPDFPIARLRDLVALGPLLLAGLGFWTVFALVFSIQWWLLAVPEPFPRIVADQLASWWPCALLTPPLAAVTLRIRALRLPPARALLLHAAGAAGFLLVGGALMGTFESLLPWSEATDGVLAAARQGVIRYLGPDLLLYCMVVAATMAAPGIVLKRPVGSGGSFKENAQLPTDITGERRSGTRASKKAGGKPTRQPKQPTDPAADRKAASAYAKEEERRRRERDREEAVRQKNRERRQRAIDKAQAALDAAREKHDTKAAEIRTEIEALEERLRNEDANWEKERARLDDLLRRARE